MLRGNVNSRNSSETLLYPICKSAAYLCAIRANIIQTNGLSLSNEYFKSVVISRDPLMLFNEFSHVSIRSLWLLKCYLQNGAGTAKFIE